MYIAFCVPGMPFNGETINNGQSLGGSETAAYYMAKELAVLGNNVVVFTNSQQTGTWDGVRYEYLGNRTEQAPFGDRFHFVLQSPYDVLIMQRHPRSFLFPYNSKVNIWWLHDLALRRHAQEVQPHLINIDSIFTVSDFHKKQVAEIYDIPSDFIYATKNGIDYNNPIFKEDIERIPGSLFYMARPERGLENLVGKNGIMEKLINCHLYVCGYDNTLPQTRDYYKFLWGRCEELPNVTNLGHLGKDELYRWLKKMQAYVYPSTFEETSCIAAMEAQACGTPFIGCDSGALSETLFNGGAILVKNKNGEVNKNKFIHTVNHVLNNKKEWQKLHEKTKNIFNPWHKIAYDWAKKFQEILAEKSSNKERLWKHYERMSDIVALTKNGANEDNCPTLRKNYWFYLDNKFTEAYEREYEHERQKGVNFGFQILDAEIFTNKRYRTVKGLIESYNPKSVLDYGCAHGAYVMNLAKAWPHVSFVGVDIEQTQVDKCKKWVEAWEYADRVNFICGQSFTISDEVKKVHPKKFDVILCGEVLEHVADPIQTIKDLREFLSPNGHFVFTTPYGPYESIGYDENPGYRAHIHHYERQDLFELFGKQPGYKIMAVPEIGRLGHFITTFGYPEDELFGQINYGRKSVTQNPLETLTVTMIAKNEAASIGRTLKSVKKWADEIIVGVDKSTTDNTKEIVKRFGGRVIDIDSPLEIGFDEARNAVIKEATCDWIMWIDSDETFEQIDNIQKYLRNNCYNAYAIKQHHYAVEPPALFKTDFPCRIFRNHKGIRFYGFVHEHPELELNKGIGKVIIIPDMSIMHTGYSTEKIRRLRFDRNWPLMQKDRAKYPDRTLGYYLWVRDLAHLIRYDQEKTHGTITDSMVITANEAIKTWRILATKNSIRMLVDAIPFYSECVRLLGKGINYGVSIGAAHITQDMQMPNAITGSFANLDDINLLNNAILKANLSVFKENYY